MSVSFLYKYGRLTEHSEALFSTPTIWLSLPSRLNDPFECRPWFTFNGDSHEVVEALAQILRRQNPGLTRDTATAHAVGIVLEGRHRDPRTWENMRNDLVAMLGHRIGLYCLSQHNDSILMWSHYSEDHKGYCLEFEATDQTPMFGAAQSVTYSDKYPVIDVIRTPNEEQIDLVFLTKFSEWKYEQEWRIIDHEIGPGTHEYPKELLKGVVFGMNMPEADKVRIRDWVSRRGHRIKFYQAARSDHEFRVDIREVE